jgi:hypothetical protein
MKTLELTEAEAAVLKNAIGQMAEMAYSCPDCLEVEQEDLDKTLVTFADLCEKINKL